MIVYVLTEKEYDALKNGEVFGEEEVEYVIPKGMKNCLKLMQTCAKLTDDEVAELEDQIIAMGEKCITHYIIHTNGRGESNPYDYYSGDRYWECDYLPRAKTMDVITQFGGNQKHEFVDRGMSYLFYENLL